MDRSTFPEQLEEHGRRGFATTDKTHLFLGVKVGVVLGHVLGRPLLDQAAAQKPYRQAGHEHADVGDEDSDAVSRIRSDHTAEKTRGRTADGKQRSARRGTNTPGTRVDTKGRPDPRSNTYLDAWLLFFFFFRDSYVL